VHATDSFEFRAGEVSVLRRTIRDMCLKFRDDLKSKERPSSRKERFISMFSWSVFFPFFLGLKSICVRSSGFFVFVFSILCCSHTGYHPREELAKFGYRQVRTVQNVKNPSKLQQAIVEKWKLQMFFLKNLTTFVHF
jgi:hypothetical protein